MSSNVGRKRRRESPSYDDYLSGEKDTHGTSGGGRHTSRSGRLERRQSPLVNEFLPAISFSRRYHAGSQYRDARRESDEEQERLLRRQRSASPRQEKHSHRISSPPYLFRDSSLSPAHRLSRLSPPTKRAEPTDDYLLTSCEHSRRLDDPTQSRKLVVLDLNGSLLFRSPHVRKTGRGTQPRLRTVHPRPFLSAFRSYIFHEETKRWLDVMVWSSAQPHSVHDMVDKCFQDRKKEFRAIWARDTLGLNQDEYHRKSPTLKDLEKPWAELDESAEGTQHSALTTILIDDSPLKAALQPWNHLCIKEYVAEMRASDLSVANWEESRRRLHEAREALEREIRQKEDLKREEEEQAERLRQEDEKRMNDAINNPENTKVIKEVVMVKGKLIGEEHVVKKVLKEVVMVDGRMVGEDEDEGFVGEESDQLSAKNRKRKKKRFAKKEAILKVKEQIANEDAKETEFEEGEIDPAELEQEHESREMKLEALAPKMKYDETLLAVIGVLDHIKYESSVAGWMRHGGLLKVEVAEDASRLSNNPYGSPPKKRRLNQTDSFHDTGPPTSPAALPPSSSQSHPSRSDHHQSPSSPPTSTSHRVEEIDEQVQTGVPLIISDPLRESPPPPSLWFEWPATMPYWTDRGRRALEALNIPAESGVVPL